MKKYISFLLLIVLLWSQSVHAESSNITSEIPLINKSISSGVDLDSAPVPIANPNIYTPWELVHRSAMLSGFQWGGEIAKFITPNMYIGTPFASSQQYIGQSNPLWEFFVKDATTYSECLKNESYLSYGLGERLEKTDILELKAIAKTCAQQFYGTYFDGTPYTTREEYIMMLMTMFGEKISLAWQFTKDGKYIASGSGVESGFKNVSPTAWYSPYLAFADKIGILSTNESKWQVARTITDTEAIDILALYTAYRMGYSGDTILGRGMIVTDNLKYNITFVSASKITVRVQSSNWYIDPIEPLMNSTNTSYLEPIYSKPVLSNTSFWEDLDIFTRERIKDIYVTKIYKDWNNIIIEWAWFLSSNRWPKVDGDTCIIHNNPEFSESYSNTKILLKGYVKCLPKQSNNYISIWQYNLDLKLSEKLEYINIFNGLKDQSYINLARVEVYNKYLIP